MDKQQIGRIPMTKSLATLFIVTIFSTSFAQMGGMGFGYSGGGGGTVDSVRVAGSAQNLQGGATEAIPFQTAAGTTSFDVSNFTWDNTNKKLKVSSLNSNTISGTNILFKRESDGLTLGKMNTSSGYLEWNFPIYAAPTGGFSLGSNTGVVRTEVTGNPTDRIRIDGFRGGYFYYSGNTLAGGYLDGKFHFGGSFTPTALVHIAAGTASANTAPLKFTAGTNLTTPEAGAMEFDGTNLYFTPSATRQTVTLSSDSSLKRNIVDYSDALKKVLAMRPVHFRYKVGSDTTLHVGLIAQELVHVDSSLVDYAVDGEARGVKYLEVIPVLVRAIQEQDARITTLEKRNMFFGIFTGVVLMGFVIVIVRRKVD
jgi:hypothetical protein